MYKVHIVFVFQLVLAICKLINFQQTAFSTDIFSGYYFGSDKGFKRVFLRINNHIAIADFIFVQKYPRELLSDTLLFDKSTNIWVGQYSILHEKDGKYYVRTKNASSIFATKKDIRIRLNEQYYKKNIDEYKNLAIWHKYYKDYLRENENKDYAMKRFYEIEKKYNLNKLQNHSCFLKEFERMKSELKYTN